MSPSPPEVLRANQLRRRAAAMGVDVYRIVRWDAAAQRESLPEADDGERENIPRSPDDGAY
jgi:hypothetical protein